MRRSPWLSDLEFGKRRDVVAHRMRAGLSQWEVLTRFNTNLGNPENASREEAR